MRPSQTYRGARRDAARELVKTNGISWQDAKAVIADDETYKRKAKGKA